MYSNNKKAVDRRINTQSTLDFLGLISPSLYLAQLKQNAAKKLIVKVIPIRSDSVQAQAAQEAVLKKVCASSLFSYLKPESYDFREGALYVCTPLLHLSLQSLLWIHRKEGRSMGREFVRQFAVKMFEGLARLKPSDIFPQNLKPSNVFLEEKGGERIWMWSEAGLHTNNLNKFYVKLSLQMQTSKIMAKVEPLEMEFYSLGIMLLEMITTQPAQEIDKVVRNKDDWDKIRNYRQASEYYGKSIISIIHYLIDVPKDGTLNKAVQDYKQFAEEQEDQLDTTAYQFTEERLSAFLKDQLVVKMIKRSKDYLIDKNIGATEVFGKIALLDREFGFGFTGMTQFQELLDFLGIRLKPHELLFVSTFYSSKSSIRYFHILKRLFSPKELIECIIAKAVENYDSFKEFFEAMTNNGRDFWKAEELRHFLEELEVPFEEKEINDTMKSWSASEKTSVKYEQLFKVFKPIIGLKPFPQPKPNPNSLVDGESPLTTLMEQLMKKEPDLVAFFRRHDLRENWIVDHKIQKILKSYLKTDDQTLKRAFAEMWEKGNIPGDISKQINYIYLIRNLKLYDNVALLKTIITQKVNESDRQTFYDKYKKDERGWTYLSFVDFNADENLQFEERQLKALFNEIDLDHSGNVDQKELYFRLTGLKEFDYGSIVESIKTVVNRQGIFLFENFKKLDSRARLVLGQPSELAQVLQSVGTELSEDHVNQLYQKFARNGKFQYLTFLLEFCAADRLFIAATKCVVKVHYKDDFQRLYQMGLQKGKKKWNRQSLGLVNQELMLCFRQIKLGQIWTALDPNSEGSLTKQEVAAAFSYDFEETEQLTQKPMPNIHDVVKKKKTHEDQHSPKAGGSISGPRGQQEGKEKEIMEQFQKLGERKLKNLPLQLLKESENHNGVVSQQSCLKVFDEFGLKFHRGQVTKLLYRFQLNQRSKKIEINYIGFYFYLLESLYKEQNQKYLPRYKAGFCVSIINEIKRIKDLSNEELFRQCKRKDRIRISDFEQMFKELIGVEVYGDDLEEAWQHWGQPQYLTLQDIDRILQTNQFRPTEERSPPERKSPKRTKLGEGNKMTDFLHGEEQLESPKLRDMMSFGERDSRFEKQGNRKPIRDSGATKKDEKDLKSRGQREKESIPTGRFGGQQSKKTSFRGNKGGQEKIELEEVNEQSMIKKNEEKRKTGKSKEQLIEKLKREVDENGHEYINQLFAKANIIEAKRFSSCLSIHYNFSQEDALALADSLASLGKIRLEALQKKLTKKNEEEGKREIASKSKEKKGASKVERSGLEVQSKQPLGKDREGRLLDPRRQKVNVPVVRQQIRMLITTFCKRFQPSQLEGYFFSDREQLTRDDFVSKCQAIGPAFTGTISHKIFDYLKPDAQDRVGILSFKLAMGLQEEMEEGEEDYLPEQLQKELKLVFQKADKDHSGFIESNEIEGLLSSLGFNQNIKEIQNYFARMDQNFDNRISYSEFRHFIEDQILPQLSTFDEEEEELEELLTNNDIFRHGSISAQTLQALLEKYGVKFTPYQMQILVRALNPEGTEVNISHFMNAVREPTLCGGKVKGIIYRIRLRKKVQLREVQKVFESISSCFVLAYTPAVIYRQQLSISTPYRPVLHESALFYTDLSLKDARKGAQNEEGLIGGELGNNDILVEILLKEVNGVPIPQKNEIKTNIIKRYLNVSIFDLSAEMMKLSVWQVEVEWDPEVEDAWRFSNNLRSLIVKIAGYEPRKFQKYVLLFELVIVVTEGSKTLEINCGCANMPLRQLVIPEGKMAKRLKLIAGLPNRSKEIDKGAISKRSGWKNFFGGDVESQLQMELVHHSKFKDLHRMIVALPSHVIINRKALHYLWTYRELIAQSAFDSGHLNPFLPSDLRVLTFLLTLDVPDLFAKVWMWWKDKAESKIKNLREAKAILKVLMQQIYLVVHAKQYELLRKYPAKPQFHNKSLQATRSKMLSEVFENMESWLGAKEGEGYKRRKNYNWNYGTLQMHEVSMPRQHITFMESLTRLTSK